jgi:cytoskeletal protein RodZ
MIPDYRSRRALPSRWAILFLAGCVALSSVIAFRARAAQTPADKPAATATQDTSASNKDASKKDTSSKDAADKSADKPSADKGKADAGSTRPPPSKAEESATIEDDPTLVPDSKESADNNVTFPIDI